MKKKPSFHVYIMRIFLIVMFVQVVFELWILPRYVVDVVEERTEKLTANTVSVLCTSMEQYMRSLEQFTLIPYMNDEFINALNLKVKYSEQPIDMETTYRINRSLHTTMALYVDLLNNEAQELLLLPFDGSVYLFSSNNNYYVKDYEYTSQEWYKKAVQANGGAVFIGNHVQDYVAKPAENGVFSVVRLIKNPTTQKPLAVIKSDMESGILQKIIESAQLDGTSGAAILDQNSDVVYADAMITKEMLSQVEREDQLIYDGEKRYKIVSDIEDFSGWRIVIFLSFDEIMASSRFVFYLTGIIVLLVSMFGLILFFSFSKTVTGSLRELADTMNAIREEGKYRLVDIKKEWASDEIQKLAEAFNEMQRGMDELADREIRAVEAQKVMQYQALQSQIQPHFIYNTLNIFIGLNRMGEKKLLEESVLALAEILHYVLDKKKNTTIGQETEIIRKYCVLQKMRFQNRLEFQICVDEKYKNCLIPRLLIQPIVENSIIHGIEDKIEGGTVSVEIIECLKEDISYMQIKVEDTGVGFEQEKIELHKGIGLGNVIERLSLFCEKSRMSINSEKNVGTVIWMWIPESELRDVEDCCS